MSGNENLLPELLDLNDYQGSPTAVA